MDHLDIYNWYFPSESIGRLERISEALYINGLSDGETEVRRAGFLNHSELIKIFLSVLKLLNDDICGVLDIDYKINITLNGRRMRHRDSKLRSYCVEQFVFWITLGESIEVLTGVKFDYGTPNYVMLDYLYDCGFE